MAKRASVEVIGLKAYVAILKGKAFKDVNRELRTASKRIAGTVAPIIVDAVGQSGAPQSTALARTVRVHSDRVPVVVKVGDLQAVRGRAVVGVATEHQAGYVRRRH